MLIDAITQERDISVKLVALATVPNLGFEPNDVQPGLSAMVKLLSDSQFHTRHEAAMALGNCGPVARPAVKALVYLLHNDKSSWQVRKAAAYALGRCGYPQNDRDVPDPTAISGLMQGLYDPSNGVRMEAIRSFMLIGPPGNDPALISLRNTLRAVIKLNEAKFPSTGIWGRIALIRLEKDLVKGNDPNLLDMMKYTTNKDASLRAEAYSALLTLSPKEAETQLSEIMSALRTEEEIGVINAGISTMVFMADKNFEVMAFLEQQAKDAATKLHREYYAAAVEEMKGFKQLRAKMEEEMKKEKEKQEKADREKAEKELLEKKKKDMDKKDADPTKDDDDPTKPKD